LSLVQKARRLNIFAEQVENWFICLGGKTFYPPSFEKSPKNFFFTHENLIVAAQVEMYGFHKIQKCLTLGSKTYRIDEFPEEFLMILAEEFFNDGQDQIVPMESILDPSAKIPKLRLVARWMPAGNYIKELREKRHFVTEQEWQTIKPLFENVYDLHGVQAPNYVTDKPMVQVH